MQPLEANLSALCELVSELFHFLPLLLLPTTGGRFYVGVDLFLNLGKRDGAAAVVVDLIEEVPHFL